MSVAAPPGAARPRVSASVVAYNNAACLGRFLDSLSQQRGVAWDAFFFNSASSDGTLRLLKESRAGEVHSSETNVGYSRGHNYNLSRCRAEYVLILNADLEIGPDMIARLVSHMDAHPEDAFAGPTVLEGVTARPFPPRRFYPGEGMIPLEPGIRRSGIAWINGCCMIVRRAALERLGGFDEDFFLYQAETDLCFRARRAGYRIGFCGDVVVHHLHRQSQRDISEYEYGRRLFEGSAVFWRKHYAPTDVARMVRFQYHLSGLLLALGRSLPRARSLSHVLDPERLRARRDVCRGLIETGRASNPGRRIPGQIFSRQSRLALEWVLQRRFPLDDY